MSTIVGNSVEFVQFVFAKAFRAQAGDSEAKPGNDQNGKGDKDESATRGQDSAAGKELGPQTRRDDYFCLC